MRYPQVYDNEWVTPKMQGYRMSCCDCGLVHELDFKVKRWGRGFKVVFRARRNARATAGIRRGGRHKKS